MTVSAPIDRGEAMLASMIDRHRRYGWSTPIGEWGHIQSVYRQDYHAALDAGDVDQLRGLLGQMFRSNLAFGLVSITNSTPTGLPHEITWRLALWAKITGSSDLSITAAPSVGNPLVIYARATREQTGVPITPDVSRFDAYAYRIAAVAPTRVLEIGSGYGGMALQLLRRCPSTRVVLCDIPETLYLAGYWLSCVTEHSVAWADENPDADIVLLPASELESWTRPVSLVFSSHSLSGMDWDTIAGYMAWIERSGARYFYHDDVTRTVTDAWLTATFAETLVSAIHVPECYREVWRERTPWMGFNDRFCEFFYERTS